MNKMGFVLLGLLFLFVFICDYKTWLYSFKEPIRLRKIRKELAKKEKLKI